MRIMSMPFTTAPAVAEILPDGPAWAYSSGPEAFRVLVVSTATFAAGGVRDHGLGFGGALARSVSGLTAHGCEVEMVAIKRREATAMTAALDPVDISGFDAVVVDLDSVSHSIADMTELRAALSRVSARMARHSMILAISSSGDVALDEARAAHLGAVVTVVALPQQDGEGAALHAARGAAAADALTPFLRVPLIWRRPVQPVAAGPQLEASARLNSLDVRWDESFSRIARMAAAAYGASGSAVSVLDQQDMVYTASAGLFVNRFRRSDTICDEVLDRPGGLLLGDATRDARFASRPPVANGTIKFYAGYRIRGPLGQPVAALCIADPEPRPVQAQDLTVLRDFAHAAERVLWNTYMTRTMMAPSATEQHYGR